MVCKPDLCCGTKYGWRRRKAIAREEAWCGAKNFLCLIEDAEQEGEGSKGAQFIIAWIHSTSPECFAYDRLRLLRSKTTCAQRRLRKKGTASPAKTITTYN